jgi:hypothetical protein
VEVEVARSVIDVLLGSVVSTDLGRVSSSGSGQ